MYPKSVHTGQTIHSRVRKDTCIARVRENGSGPTPSMCLSLAFTFLLLIQVEVGSYTSSSNKTQQEGILILARQSWRRLGNHIAFHIQTLFSPRYSQQREP
ncbi:unnamed protein product [Pipistrellus nathusii]|uniref:Uncharacterized protein n=1 Tax=Pipistrellus nathusii TaxID=59473 RepID=A0ABN9ZYK5_PIPNA